MMITEIFLILCISDCTVTGEDNFSVKNSRNIVLNMPYTKLQPKDTIQMQMRPLNLV